MSEQIQDELSPEEEAAAQAHFDIAADIAGKVFGTMPRRIVKAGGDPIDGAYVLWGLLTEVLLENGWTACDLGEEAHELAAEQDCEDHAEGHGDGDTIN